VLVSSLGVALLLVNREKTVMRNEGLPFLGVSEKSVLIAAGFLGGVVSSLVGTGENTVIFMVLVLLFRVNEKIVTPTTVILMTMVTIPGFLVHLFALRDFTPVVMGYWLAAVPVVAVGAPLGALICSHMKRHAIVQLLLFLIALEFISTLLLVPMSWPVFCASFATLVFFGSIDWAMSRAIRYRPVEVNLSMDAAFPVVHVALPAQISAPPARRLSNSSTLWLTRGSTTKRKFWPTLSSSAAALPGRRRPFISRAAGCGSYAWSPANHSVTLLANPSTGQRHSCLRSSA